MTNALILGSAYVPHLSEAHALSRDVAEAGGTMPERLANLLAAVDLLKAAPQRASDPADAILAGAAAGTLTGKTVDKLVAEAATADAAARYRADLASRAATLIARRFAAELASGGADAILDSLRGEFDTAAKVIEDGVTSINLDQDYVTFIETATPEQLATYQQLKQAVATVERIAAIPAKYFGLQSITGFGTIERPNVHGVGQLHDAALFTMAPQGDAAAESYRYRQFVTRRTRDGMRFSPWLRGGLRLNTIAEMRELVRVWAERVWAAETPPALAERLGGNPYAVDDEQRGS